MNTEFVNSQFIISEHLVKICVSMEVMWAKRLRERREAARIEAQDAAKIVGISKSYISMLEGEKSTPNWDLLAGFARAYQTSTDYILGLTNDPAPVSERGQWSPQIIAAAKLINTAPPHKRDAALAVLKAAVELAQTPNEQDADPALAVYDRMMDLLEKAAGQAAVEALETALRADAAGDTAGALRLMEAFFAGRDARIIKPTKQARKKKSEQV